MVPIRFLFAAALCYASPSLASSPLTIMWSKVSFENESGAQVTLEVRNEKLIRAEVSLHGKLTGLPSASLAGVELPVLNESNLIYSSGFVNDRPVTTVVLEIPVLDPNLEIQDSDSARRYQFVFRNDRFVERWLQVREGTLWRVVEVKRFDELVN